AQPLLSTKEINMRIRISWKNPYLIAVLTTLVVMVIIGWVFQRDLERIDQQIENIRQHDH
ncbi:MAG: hypothetical protein KBA14_09115, partial [Saprospiraceae bacterium]|nr:hypothetical protein [Saprospiraceae bacterium]